ncbi:MAG TPA: biotin/lipoyl-binding protein, partial [Sphingomicrobium sp.]|nr:biotin/lipoyl-binding protein [Sphingomicrobium sp.]
MMNRETSIHSSDTLVVVDRSRQRRRWLIIGVAAILLIAVVAFAMMGGRNAAEDKPAAGAAGGQGGQIPSVTVVVPGRSQVGRIVTASGPLAARRDQAVGIAGQGGRVVRVFVDAGSWVRRGQVLAIVDRSVQAEQASQLAAQI